MVRPVPTRSQRNRTRIAQVAARLIAEHGLTDWSSAKRKACRQLGLPPDEALPANDDIEQALREYNSLFQPAAQAASLHAQRAEALRWMVQLAEWDPLLVGGVAAGWATPHNEIRIELEAHDPKAVELQLVNAGTAYTGVTASGDAATGTQLRLESPGFSVRLVVLTPQQRRNRPRRDADERLSAADVRRLLDTEAGNVPER